MIRYKTFQETVDIIEKTKKAKGFPPFSLEIHRGYYILKSNLHGVPELTFGVVSTEEVVKFVKALEALSDFIGETYYVKACQDFIKFLTVQEPKESIQLDLVEYLAALGASNSAL